MKPRCRGSDASGIMASMSEEIELAAKTAGEVVGAVLDASGITAPAKELTGWLASWLHPRLVASAAKQMMGAVEKLERAGVRPSAVRDEQMRVLLEEGAREEDESLREKWTNLLANGLVGGDDGVPRAYAEVLRQLEPVEAQMLDAIAAGEAGVGGTDAGIRIGRGQREGLSLNGLVNLERLGLIALVSGAGPPTAVRSGSGSAEMLKPMRLTTFGARFVEACSEPPSSEVQAG